MDASFFYSLSLLRYYHAHTLPHRPVGDLHCRDVIGRMYAFQIRANWYTYSMPSASWRFILLELIQMAFRA